MSRACVDLSTRLFRAALLLLGVLFAWLLPLTSSAADVPDGASHQWYRLDAGLGVGATQARDAASESFSAGIRYRPLKHLALELEGGWWNGTEDRPTFRAVRGTSELGMNVLFVSDFRIGAFTGGPVIGCGVSKGWRTVTWVSPDGSVERVPYSGEYLNFVLGLEGHVSSRLTAFVTGRFAPQVIGDFNGWYAIKRLQVGVRIGL